MVRIAGQYHQYLYRLQRSKREAQIERDYLQNLYRYMPLGYVRSMDYDKTGTPVDYKVLDSNYAAERLSEIPSRLWWGGWRASWRSKICPST